MFREEVIRVVFVEHIERATISCSRRHIFVGILEDVETAKRVMRRRLFKPKFAAICFVIPINDERMPERVLRRTGWHQSVITGIELNAESGRAPVEFKQELAHAKQLGLHLTMTHDEVCLYTDRSMKSSIQYISYCVELYQADL